MKLNYWEAGRKRRVYLNQLPWGNGPQIYIEPVARAGEGASDWRLNRPNDNRHLTQSLTYDIEFRSMVKKELRWALQLEPDADLGDLTFHDIANHPLVQKPVQRTMTVAKARRRAKAGHVFYKG